MPGRWGAYLSAEIWIETPMGGVLVSPMPLMQTVGEYPDPQGRAIAVITAHNPGGQRADEQTNAVAQRNLEAELDRRGLAWWRADGADPSWTHIEESVAVPGLTLPDAIELGVRFGQEAVFLLTPTSLTVADCATGKIAKTGWHVEPADHDPEDHPGSDIEVTVFGENFRVGPMAKDGGGAGTADWPESLGQRAGLLCTVHTADSTITLRGDGSGGVLLGGAIMDSTRVTLSTPAPSSAQTAPPAPLPPPVRTPTARSGEPGRTIPVADVPYALAAAGVFEHAPRFEAVSWDAGEAASLFAPFLADQNFLVDATEWSSDGSRAYPASAASVPDLVLAESRWETDRDDEEERAASSSPASADRGGDYLLRIGPWYVVYQTNGAEREIDDLDAETDQAAVEAFKAYLGVPG